MAVRFQNQTDSLYPPGPDRVNRPFSYFTRRVSPDPVPGKYEFYWEEIKDNFLASQLKSNQRFQKELAGNPSSVGRLLLFGGLFALLRTALQRIPRTATYGFVMLLLMRPVIDANRTFPKMEEAYSEVAAGNPSKGKRIFKQALDNTSYSIFQMVFKPLTLGYILALVLALPKIMRNPKGIFQRGLNRTLTFMRLKPDSWLVRKIDKMYTPLAAWGDKLTEPLLEKSGWLKKLES